MAQWNTFFVVSSFETKEVGFSSPQYISDNIKKKKKSAKSEFDRKPQKAGLLNSNEAAS